MICRGCKAQLPDTYICDYCGNNYVAEMPAEIASSLKTVASGPLCPQCGCNKISIIEEKKTFSVKKALVGAAVTFNPLGAAAGFIGDKQKYYICTQCRCKWEVPKESLVQKFINKA